jgi:D-alanine-D-alanine ligase
MVCGLSGLRKLKVLALAHPELIPPDSVEGLSEKETYSWKTEYDVISTLRKNGHEVEALGAQHELAPIREKIEEWQPDIVFNLLEEFHGESVYAQNVASLLELLRIPYTGCSPRGMMLAAGKDLSKKLVKYHRIPVPQFGVFPIGKKVKRPASLGFPLIVKSISEDASRGISQASIVETDEELVKRVEFIHKRVKTNAIAEQYIDGREIYVGAFGNENHTVLPIWELEFSQLSPGQRPIATEMVKHNPDYQERRGILQGRAQNLSPQLETRIRAIVRRICSTLELDGYARIDFRLSKEGVPYFIEANPNPEIAESQEFAQAALFAGIEYGKLLDKILQIGLERAGVEA